MKRISYAVSLAAQHQQNEKLTVEEQNFLIADDCATTAANLFWLINHVVEEAAFEASEDIIHRSEDMPMNVDNVRLLKAVSTVSKIGYAVSEQLLSVVSQIEDANRRAKTLTVK